MINGTQQNQIYGQYPQYQNYQNYVLPPKKEGLSTGAKICIGVGFLGVIFVIVVGNLSKNKDNNEKPGGYKKEHKPYNYEKKDKFKTQFHEEHGDLQPKDDGIEVNIYINEDILTDKDGSMYLRKRDNIYLFLNKEYALKENNGVKKLYLIK